MHEASENANAQTHKGNDHEHQQQRIVGNSSANLTGPTHSAGENLTDIGNQTSNVHSSRSRAATLLSQR